MINAAIEKLTPDELMESFKASEADGNDVACLQILDEVKRRGLMLMDKPPRVEAADLCFSCNLPKPLKDVGYGCMICLHCLPAYNKS